jgi:hypothetical protein
VRYLKNIVKYITTYIKQTTCIHEFDYPRDTCKCNKCNIELGDAIW